MNTDERKNEILQTLAVFKVHGIRKDTKGIETVNRYQDLVMGMTRPELQYFEEGLDSDQREKFFWANSCTLSMDSMMDILKTTFIYRKVDKHFHEAVKAVDDRELKLIEREVEADQKVQDAEERVQTLKTSLDETFKSRDSWKEAADRNNTKSLELREVIQKQDINIEKLSIENQKLDSALDIVLKKVRD